jgi:predicted DNA-binding transcriptional regulator AlpA
LTIQAYSQKEMTSAESVFQDKKFVARFYGVSEAKVNRWIANGNGPRYYKIGNQVRFKIEDLIAFAEVNAHGRQSAMSNTVDRFGVPA